ncbi:hypothetical protein DDJ31_07265 [Streptomyces griseoviridis]|uniref:Uncharacterized protein n=1 Tax=Streptomyces griseoviridis TaxID=45398 RepID=A0ABX5TPW0_STRGD|nr:hypothetical protein DDJ31_07265 [Streptomyces griseoviridis]
MPAQLGSCAGIALPENPDRPPTITSRSATTDPVRPTCPDPTCAFRPAIRRRDADSTGPAPVPPTDLRARATDGDVSIKAACRGDGRRRLDPGRAPERRTATLGP